MNSTCRAVCCLILFGLLFAVAPLNAQSQSADDTALWQAANAATFGAKQLGYHYDFQLDFDGMHTFAAGFRLKGQGQIDRSGTALKVAFDALGDVRLGSAYTFPLNLQSRLIDGQFYLNTSGAPSDWQTMPFDKTRVTFSGGVIDAPSVPADLGFSVEDTPFMEGFYSAIPDLLAMMPEAFTNPTRQPDVDGLADFQIRLDLPKLAANEVIGMFRNFSQNEGIFQVTFDDAKWKKFGQELAVFIGHTNIIIDVFIDPATKAIQHILVDGTGTADPATMGMTDGPMTGKLHLDLTFDAPDNAQTIGVPDGAKPVESLAFPLGVDVPALQPDVPEQLLMRFGVVKEGESLTFPLDLKGGQTLTASARGMGLDFDTVLTLTSSSGSELITNDYHDDPEYMMGPNVAEIKNFKIPADGTYQLRVDQYDHAAGAFMLSIYIAE